MPMLDRSNAATIAGPDPFGVPLRIIMTALVLMPPSYALTTYFEPAFQVMALPLVGTELALLAVMLRLLHELPDGIPRPSPGLLAAYAIFTCVSLLAARINAPFPPAAYAFFARTSLHLFFGLTLYAVLQRTSTASIRQVMIALWLGSVLHILVAYAVIIGHAGDPEFPWQHFPVGVGHVRHLGYLATLELCLSFCLLSTARTQRARQHFTAGLVLGLTFICLTGSRGALMASIAAMGVCWLFSAPDRRIMLLVTSAAALAIAIPLSFLFVPPHPLWGFPRIIGQTVGAANLDEASNNRTLLWQVALENIRKHPWIGHGQAQFKLIFGRWGANHPHSDPLGYLFQWGAIGTAAVAYPHWLALRRPFAAQRLDKRAALPALGIVLGLGTLSLIDGPLFYTYTMLAFVIGLAAMAALTTRPVSEK